MDFVKSWTMSVCLTLIISVVFITLSPKGTIGKFYKVIISIFIFISFLYPLTDFDFAEFRINSDFESDYSNAMENSIDVQIENKIKNVLEENSVKSSRVDVKTIIVGDEITIDKVIISVVDGYDVDEVQKMIFDNLGIIADVKRIGE